MPGRGQSETSHAVAPKKLCERLSTSAKMCDGVGGAGDIFFDLTCVVCDLPCLMVYHRCQHVAR